MQQVIVIGHGQAPMFIDMLKREAIEEEFLVLIENAIENEALQAEKTKEEEMFPYTLTYDKMPYIEDYRVFEPFTLADKIALRKPHHKQKRRKK